MIVLQKRKYVNSSVGLILKDLRQNRELTQSQVAKAINISESSIAHYEKGISLPSVDTLVLFAKFFNVTTDYILGLSTMKSDYNTMMNKTFSGTTTYGKMIEKVQSLSNRNRSIISELIDALSKK